MRPNPWGKALKFGKLLANFYSQCAQRKAEAIGRFADKAHRVVFRGRKPYALAKEMAKHETKSLDSQPV